MTIGFTLLLIINTQALPLNNTISPTQSQCVHQIEAIKDIQPKHELVCGGVWRRILLMISTQILNYEQFNS